MTDSPRPVPTLSAIKQKFATARTRAAETADALRAIATNKNYSDDGRKRLSAGKRAAAGLGLFQILPDVQRILIDVKQRQAALMPLPASDPFLIARANRLLDQLHQADGDLFTKFIARQDVRDAVARFGTVVDEAFVERRLPQTMNSHDHVQAWRRDLVRRERGEQLERIERELAEVQEIADEATRLAVAFAHGTTAEIDAHFDAPQLTANGRPMLPTIASPDAHVTSFTLKRLYSETEFLEADVNYIAACRHLERDAAKQTDEPGT